MSSNSITNSTLEQLDGENWGEPVFDSFLVKRTHALRKIPLNKLTVEDLRLMIGQQFSLAYLMPIAIEVLNKDLMTESDFHPGDLLQSVLKIDAAFWQNNGQQWSELDTLLAKQKDLLDENEVDCRTFYNNRPVKR